MVGATIVSERESNDEGGSCAEGFAVGGSEATAIFWGGAATA